MTTPDAGSADAVARQISRRSVALGIGFAVTAGAAAAVTPRRHERSLGDARLADVVPTQVGAYQVAPGGSLILPEDEQPTSVYDQVLARTYTGANLPGIMLLIAYGAAQSGLMKVHRPEVCYASSGFSIRNDRAVDIPVGMTAPIAAKGFLAVREDRVEQVMYWTRISNTFPRDLTSQRLVMLERGLSGVIPDGVLVRCSTLTGDASAGQAAMANFARALVTSAAPAGRALLVGGLRPTAPG
jgi:EpsI family protein